MRREDNDPIDYSMEDWEFGDFDHLNAYVSAVRRDFKALLEAPGLPATFANSGRLLYVKWTGSHAQKRTWLSGWTPASRTSPSTTSPSIFGFKQQPRYLEDVAIWFSELARMLTQRRMPQGFPIDAFHALENSLSAAQYRRTFGSNQSLKHVTARRKARAAHPNPAEYSAQVSPWGVVIVVKGDAPRNTYAVKARGSYAECLLWKERNEAKLRAGSSRKGEEMRAYGNPLTPEKMAEIRRSGVVPPNAFFQMGKDQLAEVVRSFSREDAARAQAELTRRGVKKASARGMTYVPPALPAVPAAAPPVVARPLPTVPTAARPVQKAARTAALPWEATRPRMEIGVGAQSLKPAFSTGLFERLLTGKISAAEFQARLSDANRTAARRKARHDARARLVRDQLEAKQALLRETPRIQSPDQNFERVHALLTQAKMLPGYPSRVDWDLATYSAREDRPQCYPTLEGNFVYTRDGHIVAYRPVLRAGPQQVLAWSQYVLQGVQEGELFPMDGNVGSRTNFMQRLRGAIKRWENARAASTQGRAVPNTSTRWHYAFIRARA